MIRLVFLGFLFISTSIYRQNILVSKSLIGMWLEKKAVSVERNGKSIDISRKDGGKQILEFKKDGTYKQTDCIKVPGMKDLLTTFIVGQWQFTTDGKIIHLSKARVLSPYDKGSFCPDHDFIIGKLTETELLVTQHFSDGHKVTSVYVRTE